MPNQIRTEITRSFFWACVKLMLNDFSCMHGRNRKGANLCMHV
jgi:hypothetical protein